MHECTSNCRRNGCPDPKLTSYCRGIDCDDDRCRCDDEIMEDTTSLEEKLEALEIPTAIEQYQRDVETNNSSLIK